MASDQDIFDFLRSLFTNSGTAQQLAHDPARAFADHGVSDATPEQLNQCAYTLATSPGALPPSLQARLESAISSPGGMFSSAGYQGNAPMVLAQSSPVLAGYAQTAATLTAATLAPAVTQVTNVTENVDASTRYTDASLHQQLTNIGGTMMNAVTSASGDGAVAAGPDSHVTAATGAGSAAIGENAQVQGGVFTGPISDSTVIGRDANAANISGHDHVSGSGNMTDAEGTGANLGGTNVGSSTEVANKGGIVAGDGGSVNAGSPGAAAASGGSQAASGGGAPGAEGGSVDGGGNTVQVGGTNVAATGSEGVNTAGGGDANQINQSQPQIGFGTGAGGEPGSGVGTEGTQIASITPDGGGPVFFDQAHDPGTQLASEDPGTSQPVDPGVSDQPAGTEHVDPLA